MASSHVRAGGTAAGLVASGAALAAAGMAQLPAAAGLAALLVAAFGTALIDAAARPSPSREPASDASLRDRARLALTAMLDHSPTPLLLADGAALTAINRAARRLFGVDDRLPDPPAGLSAAVTAGGGTFRYGPDNRPFVVAVAEIDGFGRVASLVDITADLRVAEATAARELMLVLSHEIMNGMTPIASLAQSAAALASEGGSITRDLHDAIQTIARRADGLATFSAAYRDLARLPPPLVAPVAVRAFTDDLARLFAARWGADLAVTLDPSDLTIDADAGQLSQALWALLQNAGEAGRPSGVTLTIAATTQQVEFSVTDRGPGVPAAIRVRVFEPFFTTRATGSGIGLALARQVFRSHGGDLILVDHRDGASGAHFRGSMPRHRRGS